jgi:hypothetical protein
MGYVVDEKGKSIRGSFINALMTFIYLTFIVWAFFDDNIRKHLLELSPFMTWFFVASFGIWRATGVITDVLSSGTGGTTTDK